MSQEGVHTMSSKTPYLVRAMHEWILDNGLTPYLMVDATLEGVEVPPQYVEDGKIVLNVSPSSTRDLDIGNDFIFFGARFAGVAMDISVPTRAILAIYARENSQGLAFSAEAEDAPPETPSAPPEGPTNPGSGGKPSLRVVK